MPQVAGKKASLETPEDVAALYAWADLKGAKYHDFAAARRVFRAQVREHSAQQQSQTELRGRAETQANRPHGGQEAITVVAEHPVSFAERPAAARFSGKESMLPQRFPRRRQARDLAPDLADLAEESSASAMAATSRRGLVIADVRAGASQEKAVERTTAAVGPGPERVTGLGAEPQADSAGTRAAALKETTEAQATGPVPAWIHGEGGQSYGDFGAETTPVAERRGPEASPVLDTLQHSRERVASRWYALRGVFDPAAPAMEPTQAHTREGGSPVLALFSLAGGVGKTSLTAALGRALSAVGEQILLADITAHALLPYYFGSQELRSGVLRKFLPPQGSPDAPISLVSYELTAHGDSGKEEVPAELLASRENFDRIIVDLSPAAPWKTKGLVQMEASILVPVAPDMNSVIGLSAVERFFAGLSESAGRVVQPRYLLTQFDSALPLHLDVREVMRQQLGERLLPFVIRRSPAVAEALAEGMTVMDYAPESGVADDYRDLATWVRTVAAPAQTGRNKARWSER